jgi:hypothetical protein
MLTFLPLLRIGGAQTFPLKVLPSLAEHPDV